MLDESAPSSVSTGSAPERLTSDSVVAGRYRVLGHLGSGGMGAVYRAEHVHMRKTVALKVLHAELCRVNEVVARFEREAIAAGHIDHPNVVAASDFGKLEDGSFYLVLEYVDGRSLRSLLEQGPLPHARSVEIARQTALALRAAHALGIVHRDLKPDNVMLVPEPGGGDRVKVLDFGIARVTIPGSAPDATNLTRVGVIMGTVAYMSPEQATGQEVDGRTDLYALGVMLYEMISGRQPFEAELPSQVLARQLVEKPPPLPAGTPPALSALVLALMEKGAADRPESADAVLERLNALTVTPSGRVGPPPRDLRRIATLGAGAAVLLFGLVTVAALSGGKEEPGASASAESAAAPLPAPGDSARAGEGQPEAILPVAGATSAVASAVPAPPASAASARPVTKAGTKSSGPRKKPAPQSNEARKPERRTGPGGIYIPPPDQWF
ncbi:MAG TPA: serine/threonine-protein kinase [Polyangiaceae bacterium]